MHRKYTRIANFSLSEFDNSLQNYFTEDENGALRDQREIFLKKFLLLSPEEISLSVQDIYGFADLIALLCYAVTVNEKDNFVVNKLNAEVKNFLERIKDFQEGNFLEKIRKALKGIRKSSQYKKLCL